MLELLLMTALAQNVLPPVPGRVDPSVTQENIHRTICNPGYTVTVRNVTALEKRAVYQRDHKKPSKGICCEIDHVLPLELGGSNDLSNLWAQPYEPRPGAHEKDKVENWLRERVCFGKITLAEAQKVIMTDWATAYAQMMVK
jgi:hypothetical protein